MVRFRRSFARLGGGVSVPVIPELTEHPGAEDDTKSWQGEVDVGVRVCLNMGAQLGFRGGDLGAKAKEAAASWSADAIGSVATSPPMRMWWACWTPPPRRSVRCTSR